MIEQAQWTEVWKRQDHNLPIRGGIEARLEGNMKLYRAYCNYPAVMARGRVESPVYEAVDEADPYVPSVGGNYIHQGLRDRVIAEAAVARSNMTEDQKSFQDVIKIAEDLMATAIREYNQFQREESERERMRVSDLEALKSFRAWLRGAELCTDEEKTTLRSILGKK